MKRAVPVLAIPVAWLLPWATHALGVDGALPVLLLLGIASLLRGGRTLLRLALSVVVETDIVHLDP